VRRALALDGSWKKQKRDPGNAAARQHPPQRFVAAHDFWEAPFIRPLWLLK
jgi:hypothetical protein